MRLTGNGPAFIKVGRLVRYEMASIQAWLLAHQRASTSAIAELEVAANGAEVSR